LQVLGIPSVKDVVGAIVAEGLVAGSSVVGTLVGGTVGETCRCTISAVGPNIVLSHD
jgi:hypothetical protein